MKLSHIHMLVLNLGVSLVLTVVGCSSGAKKERLTKTSDPIQLGVAAAKDVPL